jgi:hypothetical protein
MNPGILISVPFPFSPPTLDLPLPFAINDIVISELELTNVELREVDYTWKLTTSYAEVNVSKAVVSFDWYYKKDSGKGFFIEDELRLDFDWNFTMNKESRFQIVITNTKVRPGKSKV